MYLWHQGRQSLAAPSCMLMRDKECSLRPFCSVVAFIRARFRSSVSWDREGATARRCAQPFLHALADAEMRVKGQLARALEEKSRGERDIIYFDRAFAELGHELAAALASIRRSSRRIAWRHQRCMLARKIQARDIEDRAVAQDADPDLARLRDRLHEVGGQLAIVRSSRAERRRS